MDWEYFDLLDIFDVLNYVPSSQTTESTEKLPSKIEVAQAVGIRNPYSIAEWVTPREQYRDQNKTLICNRTGTRPDPPQTVIARYELPDETKEILAHQTHATILQQEYPLHANEARVLSRHLAGWKVDDLRELKGGMMEPDTVLTAAKEAIVKSSSDYPTTVFT